MGEALQYCHGGDHGPPFLFRALLLQLTGKPFLPSPTLRGRFKA
jgi:hypothetical protein